MKRTILLMTAFICMAHMAMAQKADTSGIALQEVSVKAWRSEMDRYHYNQTKYYITTILPYVNATTQLFKEINAKADDPNVSRREYKAFIAAKQDQMKTEFEDKIKALNVTQGGLLVKLIARQTNLNLYKMIADVKNPFVAMKWQSWALVNGMNLDKKYHPEDEPMLEKIMAELGYPLPASYVAN